MFSDCECWCQKDGSKELCHGNSGYFGGAEDIGYEGRRGIEIGGTESREYDCCEELSGNSVLGGIGLSDRPGRICKNVLSQVGY